jgi:hypothetical protein
VTEVVVPWVPIFTVESGYLTSSRVATLSLDQGIFGSFPALDQVVLEQGAAVDSTVTPSAGTP